MKKLELVITVYTKPACVQGNATYNGLDREGLQYDPIDITLDLGARDFVMSLGYLQVPVVYARWILDGTDAKDAEVNPKPHEHWSGFRPDRIKDLGRRYSDYGAVQTAKI